MKTTEGGGWVDGAELRGGGSSAAFTVASVRISCQGDVLNEVWLKTSRSFPSPPWQLPLQIKNYLSGQNLRLTGKCLCNTSLWCLSKGRICWCRKPTKSLFFSYSNFSYSNSNSGSQQAEQRLAYNTLIKSQIKLRLHLSPVFFIILICCAAPGQVLSVSPNPSICCYLSVNFTFIKRVCFDEREHDRVWVCSNTQGTHWRSHYSTTVLIYALPQAPKR